MRVLRWGLVLLLVLGVLLVVADRVGVWAAERTVADQVANELAGYQVDSEPPQVSIAGFPFLTQVGGGRYEEVTLVLDDVGTGVARLSRVELVASGVTADADTLMSGSGPIDAERVDGTAVISYPEVVGLVGVDGLRLGPGEGERLQVRLDTEVLGEPVTVAGTATFELMDDAVRLRGDELAVEEPEQLPFGVDQAIEDAMTQLAWDAQLPPLPYGLTVTAVRAQPDGLVVEVSATDVPLAR